MNFHRNTSRFYCHLISIFFLIIVITGCGKASTTSQDPRVLELQIKLLSEVGTPIVNEIISLIDRRFLFRYQEGQLPIKTDANGMGFAVMEYLPHRGTTLLWDALLPPPDLSDEMVFTLKLPQISPKGKYEVALLFSDPKPTVGWGRTGVLDPVFAPPPEISSDKKLFRSGKHYYAKNGAVYRTFDGSLFQVEMLANGIDTRLVPPMRDELERWRYKRRSKPGIGPGPRIKMKAKLKPLGRYRDRLSIELVVIYHDHG